MKTNIRLPLYIVLTAFLFGTMEVALKIAGTHFQSAELTFLRFLIGGLLLLPFAIVDLKHRHCRLSLRDWGYLLLLGVICICLSMYVFQLGVMRTNANLAAVIISINPIFTMIFAHFLTSDKFTVRKGIVLAICIVGLVVVSNPLSLVGNNHLSGILLVLFASVFFGLYTALGKRHIARIGGIAQTSFGFLLGAAVMLVFMLVFHMPVTDGITISTLPIVLYLGVFVTGVGYYFFLKAVEIGSPSLASISFFIKPVIAVILAAIILSEPVTVHMVIGILIILAGLTLLHTGRRTSAANVLPLAGTAGKNKTHTGSK